MSDCKVFIDCEFYFKNIAEPAFITFQEGVDCYREDDERFSFEITSEAADLLIVHDIVKADLRYTKRTRRAVRPSASVTDGGQTRIEHGDTLLELS